MDKFMDYTQNYLKENMDELSNVINFAKTLIIKDDETARHYESNKLDNSAPSIIQDIRNGQYIPTKETKEAIIREMLDQSVPLYAKITETAYLEGVATLGHTYIYFPYERITLARLALEINDLKTDTLFMRSIDENGHYLMTPIPRNSVKPSMEGQLFQKSTSGSGFKFIEHNSLELDRYTTLYNDVSPAVEDVVIIDIKDLSGFLSDHDTIVYGDYLLEGDVLKAVNSPLYIMYEDEKQYLYNYRIGSYYSNFKANSVSIDRAELFLDNNKIYHATIKTNFIDVSDKTAENIALLQETFSMSGSSFTTITSTIFDRMLAKFDNVFLTENGNVLIKAILADRTIILPYSMDNKEFDTTTAGLEFLNSSPGTARSITFTASVVDSNLLEITITNSTSPIDPFLLSIHTPSFNYYKRIGKMVYYGDFVLKQDKNTEKNLYYIELAKSGIAPSYARSTSHKAILTSATSTTYFNTDDDCADFLVCYSEARDYYMKTMYNSTYRLFASYEGLSSFLIIMIAIFRYIDKRSQNVSNIYTFNENILDAMFVSFGLDLFLDLPKELRIRLLRNLNLLFINKGNNIAFKTILDMFKEDFQDANLERYYIIRDLDTSKFDPHYLSPLGVEKLEKEEAIELLERRSINLNMELPFAQICTEYFLDLLSNVNGLYSLLELYKLALPTKYTSLDTYDPTAYLPTLLHNIIIEQSMVDSKVSVLSIDAIKEKLYKAKINFEESYEEFIKLTILSRLEASMNVPEYSESMIFGQFRTFEQTAQSANIDFSIPYRALTVHLQSYTLELYTKRISTLSSSEILALARTIGLDLPSSYFNHEEELDIEDLKIAFLNALRRLLNISTTPPSNINEGNIDAST